MQKRNNNMIHLVQHDEVLFDEVHDDILVNDFLDMRICFLERGDSLHDMILILRTYLVECDDLHEEKLHQENRLQKNLRI
jgi:hypothetical protein